MLAHNFYINKLSMPRVPEASLDYITKTRHEKTLWFSGSQTDRKNSAIVLSHHQIVHRITTQKDASF